MTREEITKLAEEIDILLNNLKAKNEITNKFTDKHSMFLFLQSFTGDILKLGSLHHKRLQHLCNLDTEAKP